MVFSFKDCEDIATITRHNEIRKENALGKNMMLLALNILSSVVKNPPANAGDGVLISGLGRFPWSRKWKCASVFFPGKFNGHRNLAGYGSWGPKESDMTEHAHILSLEVLIQHPSGHIQLAVEMQKTKLVTKHRNLARVYW